MKNQNGSIYGYIVLFLGNTTVYGDTNLIVNDNNNLFELMLSDPVNSYVDVFAMKFFPVHLFFIFIFFFIGEGGGGGLSETMKTALNLA